MLVERGASNNDHSIDTDIIPPVSKEQMKTFAEAFQKESTLWKCTNCSHHLQIDDNLIRKASLAAFSTAGIDTEDNCDGDGNKDDDRDAGKGRAAIVPSTSLSSSSSIDVDKRPERQTRKRLDETGNPVRGDKDDTIAGQSIDLRSALTASVCLDTLNASLKRKRSDATAEESSTSLENEATESLDAIKRIKTKSLPPRVEEKALSASPHEASVKRPRVVISNGALVENNPYLHKASTSKGTSASSGQTKPKAVPSSSSRGSSAKWKSTSASAARQTSARIRTGDSCSSRAEMQSTVDLRAPPAVQPGSSGKKGMTEEEARQGQRARDRERNKLYNVAFIDFASITLEHLDKAFTYIKNLLAYSPNDPVPIVRFILRKLLSIPTLTTPDKVSESYEEAVAQLTKIIALCLDPCEQSQEIARMVLFVLKYRSCLRKMADSQSPDGKSPLDNRLMLPFKSARKFDQFLATSTKAMEIVHCFGKECSFAVYLLPLMGLDAREIANLSPEVLLALCAMLTFPRWRADQISRLKPWSDSLYFVTTKLIPAIRYLLVAVTLEKTTLQRSLAQHMRDADWKDMTFSIILNKQVTFTLRETMSIMVDSRKNCHDSKVTRMCRGKMHLLRQETRHVKPPDHLALIVAYQKRWRDQAKYNFAKSDHYGPHLLKKTQSKPEKAGESLAATLASQSSSAERNEVATAMFELSLDQGIRYWCETVALPQFKDIHQSIASHILPNLCKLQEYQSEDEVLRRSNCRVDISDVTVDEAYGGPVEDGDAARSPVNDSEEQTD